MVNNENAVKSEEALCPKMDRWTFIKGSALLGGSALLASQMDRAFNLMSNAEAGYLMPSEEYELAKAENVIYSVCLACHTRCPIKAKLLNGILVKVDGSPYSAFGLIPQIPYETIPATAASVDGKLCPKGQASVQIQYDPYRVRKVLKRAGRRGENKWVTIPFEQAIDEIVNGGLLFKNIPGEESRKVSGLNEIFALRDAAVAKAMADDVEAIRKKKMTVEEFQAKHKANLHLLIDPKHPDLGPKNNQFVFLAGRIQHGRKEFGQRFTKDSFGSINFYEHTSICEQSHHIASAEMTRDLKSGGGVTHFKPDLLNAEFVIFWGTGAFEANFGPTPMAELVTKSLVERNLKIAVVDPRLSKTAAKAWRWVPVKPSGDAALALGMMRWILENGRYDKRYLENPNANAGKTDGEPTWTNATHLVRTDKMVLLRAEDIGLSTPKVGVKEGTPKLEWFAAMTEGGPRLAEEAETGLLEVDTKIKDIPVKTVFTLLKERAAERSLEEYGELSGVSPKLIVELAREYTSHGKKAAIDTYRGPVQHTNGYYAQQAILTLALLNGCADWKGGLTKDGGHWHELGDKEGQPFDLKKMHPGKLKAFGLAVSKEKAKYEESTLFTGYPAKRPWYPFTSNIYQEVIPAADAGYPYSIKALWIHKGTPILSTPAGQKQIEPIRDVNKIPLLFADDVVIGETSMYADYIFPDLTYMERWGTPHDNPQPSLKTSKVRQPVVGPVPETATIDGEQMPISMEAVMIAIGKKLGLPGIGKDGFGPGVPLNRPEDYFLKMVANIAWGDKPAGDGVPDATKEETELFVKARRHLPKSVFDIEKWQRIVTPQTWRKVVYILNRGGRFEHLSKQHDGEYMHHKFGNQFHLFVERVAKAKDSVTGKPFDGLPRYEPPIDSAGREVLDKEFEFQLITYKEIAGGHSRTIPTYWTQVGLMPENRILINRRDADRLGIRDGDQVRIVSKTNQEGTWDLGDGRKIPMQGNAAVIQGIRPGVAAVSWSSGHWAYGSADVVIDGKKIKGDPRRAGGLCPNAAMRVDDYLKNTCLTDPIGGSASFYDTKVNIVRV